MCDDAEAVDIVDVADLEFIGERYAKRRRVDVFDQERFGTFLFNNLKIFRGKGKKSGFCSGYFREPQRLSSFQEVICHGRQGFRESQSFGEINHMGRPKLD